MESKTITQKYIEIFLKTMSFETYIFIVSELQDNRNT